MNEKSPYLALKIILGCLLGFLVLTAGVTALVIHYADSPEANACNFQEPPAQAIAECTKKLATASLDARSSREAGQAATYLLTRAGHYCPV